MAAVNRREVSGRPSPTDRLTPRSSGASWANPLAPDHQALEAELAHDLGMSRTLVREALIRLEAEGGGSSSTHATAWGSELMVDTLVRYNLTSL